MNFNYLIAVALCVFAIASVPGADAENEKASAAPAGADGKGDTKKGKKGGSYPSGGKKQKKQKN